METYFTNFDFNKVVDYRIQQHYTRHRRESHNHMEADSTLLITPVKPANSYQ